MTEAQEKETELFRKVWIPLDQTVQCDICGWIDWDGSNGEADGTTKPHSDKCPVGFMSNKIDRLTAELEAIKQEGREAYVKRIEKETGMIGMNKMPNGEWRIDFEVAKEVMTRQVEAARCILDKAENYVESVVQEINPCDGKEGYILTIQRKNGKTPHQKRVEAEAERDRLRVELNAMRESCASIAESTVVFVPFEGNHLVTDTAVAKCKEIAEKIAAAIRSAPVEVREK